MSSDSFVMVRLGSAPLNPRPMNKRQLDFAISELLSETASTNNALRGFTYVLPTLNNVHNITLLVESLLDSVTIWTSFAENELIYTLVPAISQCVQARLKIRSNSISFDKWLAAITGALSKRGDPWQHCIICAGLVLGVEKQAQDIKRTVRWKLQYSYIHTMTKAIKSTSPEERWSLFVAHSYVSDNLTPYHKQQLPCDELAPQFTSSLLSADYCLQDFSLLAALPHVVHIKDGKMVLYDSSPLLPELISLNNRRGVKELGLMTKCIADMVPQIKKESTLHELISM